MCLSLLKEDWDVAIILDACRYDTFKEVYEQYLPSGKLEKKCGASDTLDWLYSVFGKDGREHNVIYVSAHPGINSKGVAWGFFNANKKFYKVYDAWLNGWDWKIGTALPEEVAKIAIQTRKKNPNKKIIAHFMQPHFPYRKAPCPSTYSDLRCAKRNPKLAILLEKLLRGLISFMDFNFSTFRTTYWTAKKVLNLNFLEDLNEFYWKEYDVKDLKYFYKDNLEWVLSYVKKMVEELDDVKIIITSDHGEAFGESGDFFHLYKTRNPVVRQVPFWRNTT
jgi:hypothetical protein